MRPLVRATLKLLRERGKKQELFAALSGSLFLVVGISLAHIIPLPSRLYSEDSTLVVYRDGSPAHLFLAPDERWRVGMPVEEIDRHYIDALIALEDQRFWSHPGVDPVAITRAALSNISRGKVVSGASTITMQLVRVLEPRERTLYSKCVEALRAVQLEVLLSKEEILFHYLRFAPYGRNIEGIDAASMAYFGHRADALSNAEIATLLAVPQAPNTRYPSSRNLKRLSAARAQIASELLAADMLFVSVDKAQTKQQAYDALIVDPVPPELLPFPREIPHLAQWLRHQADASSAGGAGERIIRTSIDRTLQSNLERLVAERQRELYHKEIFNGAVVVADHQHHKIVGVVGNLGFGDEKSLQMQAFRLPRSTGSLLKPVITAMAIDDGAAHPEQLVKDVPVHRKTWSPQNFSGQFHGVVKLGDALVKSLNIPFILLIEELTPERLLAVLSRAHFEHLNHAPNHYGLGIAVGGVEATPVELVGLYATFANGGMYQPLSLVDLPESSRKGQEPTRLWSSGANWLVSEVLSERERPDLPWRADLPVEKWKIHWKTGTSNNHRDAWSVGYGGDYTVAVWLGNLDGSSSPALVGSQVASPLMFDVMESILPPELEEQSAPDSELVEVEVCQYSGFVPTEACPHRKMIKAPVSSVPVEKCSFHKQIDVLVDTGEMTRKGCQQGRAVRQEAVLYFEPDVLPYTSTQDRSMTQLPAWAPGCAPQSAERAPEILTPQRGQRILLIPGIPAERQRVPLSAQSNATRSDLSWFMDGEFLGSTHNREQLWWVPLVGVHEMIVMDDTGKASRRELGVEAR